MPGLLEKTRHPDCYFAVSVNHDGHLAAPLFKTSEIDLKQSVVTFENLIAKTPFVSLIRKVLQKLEQAYGHPFDMEFAWDEDQLYILQCRFLPLREELDEVSLPQNIPRERLLFSNDQGVSSSIVKDVEYLVYVDPRANGRAIVTGRMGAPYDGCVLVRHNRKDKHNFIPERAVKVFSKTGNTGWAAAYKIDDCQPANGLPGMS